MSDLYDLYRADHDFPTGVRTRRSYVIASTPRSGSTHLAACLWREGDLGAPLEYLNPLHIEQMSARLGAENYVDYWRAVQARRTSPNGVFGHKLFQPYYVMAVRHCPDLLPLLRSDVAVHLYRRDKVAQAVSLARAQQTQAWCSWSADALPSVYSRGLIGRCLRSLLNQERWWRSAFELTGADVLSAAYEDYQGREAALVDAVRQRLGLPRTSDCPPAPIPTLSRQGDAVSAEWIARFKADVASRLAREGGRAGVNEELAQAVGL